MKIEHSYIKYLIFLAAWLPATAMADACQLETPNEVNVVRDLIKIDTMIVTYCWYCNRPESLPLRVRQIGFQHTEPDYVRVIAWANAPTERIFPLKDLEQAERDDNGPLAEFIRQDINKEYSDTTGYLGPNDPYLMQEKKDRYDMLLGFARKDHDMRTSDELYINGEPADPRLLYAPVGEDRFQSVGYQIGCLMDGAPQSVVFRPVLRDPEKASPSEPFIADVTGQCYDGACPRDHWQVIRQTPLFADSHDNAAQIGMLNPQEEVDPVKTESHVMGARLVVSRDHHKFFTGDVLYLLDSQAEGFYRVWHYGDVFVVDATGVNLSGRTDECERNETCWASGSGYPSEIWWSRIRRRDGSEAWVREPIRNLDGVLRSD